MIWSVSVTNVLSTERRNAANLTTEEVLEFILETTPMDPRVAERLWLDLVTTKPSAANFGVYQFSATATEDSDGT